MARPGDCRAKLSPMLSLRLDKKPLPMGWIRRRSLGVLVASAVAAGVKIPGAGMATHTDRM